MKYLQSNTLSPRKDAAIEQVTMLKTVMAGEKLSSWKENGIQTLKLNNVEMIEKAYDIKMKLEDNEQILEKSRKEQKSAK